ncbi:MAG TPA: carboxypeptidase-like regulatory domain-containing protein [Vicinamibacterales bacterium]|nr:carboxypeptidase-like regulatory domain-containing protein [Vicinamibacterales bacterium]
MRFNVTRALACVSVLLTMLSAGTSFAQSPTATEATVSLGGRVTADKGGTGMAGVRVELTGGPEARSESRATTTGSDGRYVFAELPPGTYAIRASRVGHVAMAHGQQFGRSSWVGITLRAGESRRDIDVTLLRSGAITVHVLDEFGNPHSGVLVTVLENRVRDERNLVPISSGNPLDSIIPRVFETDDRGDIRIYGLPPGDYYVKADMPEFRAMLTDGIESADMRMQVYSSVYHPGVASSVDAQPITLGAGEELHVTIGLAPVRTAVVSGTVITEDGKPASGFVVLSMADTPGAAVPLLQAPLENGRFQFDDVRPGEYLIEKDAEEPGAGEPDYDALRITVDGVDIDGLLLRTMPLRPLSGRIVFEGKASSRDLSPSDFFVMTSTTLGTSGFAQINDDWTFSVASTHGPSVLQPRAPDGWYADRIRLGNLDATDTPLSGADGLEVVFTSTAATLRGRLMTRRGDPVVAATLVIVPEDPVLRRISSRAVRTVLTDVRGLFRASGLPPGRYVVLSDVTRPSGDEDLAALGRFASESPHVSLVDGDDKTLDIRLPKR